MSKVVVDQNRVCLNRVFVESLSVTETFEITFETLKITIWVRLLIDRDGARGKVKGGVDKKMPTRKQLMLCNTKV